MAEKDDPADEEQDMLDEGKYGKRRDYDPSFNGPIQNRSCTDIICCIIFIIFIIGMIACSIFAYSRGDPYRLIHPTDSQGRICGRGELQNKPNLFFFDLLQCAKLGIAVVAGCPTPQVCVENCPSSNYVYREAELDDKKRKMAICDYGIDPTKGSYEDYKNLVKTEKCAAYHINSTNIFGRCIPSVFGQLLNQTTAIVSDSGESTENKDGESVTGVNLRDGVKHLANFYKVKQYGERVFEDITASWYTILIGFFVAMVVSLLWTFLLRWIVGVVVWFTMIAFLGIFGFGTYYSYRRYYDLKNQNFTEEFSVREAFSFDIDYYLSLQKTWLAFGCTSATVLIIFILVLIFLAKRICIAIELIKEGSKAIGQMMFTLLWPITPFLLQILVFIYWGSSAMYIASMGPAEYVVNETQTQEGVDFVLQKLPCQASQNDTSGKLCHFVKYGGDEYSIYMQAYMLFMFFWLMNFVVALGEMVLAGAFASYYWAFDKPKDIPSYPLFNSLYRAIRFHTGSLAFGALLVAIVQMIRVVLEYIDQKLKNAENKCAQYCMKCMKCCFWCLEKILRFINKNAYIMIAVYGRNFCTAAKDGFFLIMRNIVRTVVLDNVTDFILFISKLMITCAIGIAAYFFYQAKIPVLSSTVPSLNYYLTPVIILVVGSYLITCSFFDVYNMAVDTLFLCFLEDIERNDGSADKPYFMSKGLQKILRKSNKMN
ncbi:choline transporter-like protein 2 [Patella vulgata]|uniref:choline transporter-like protein 2 n=1 Tax=Patella vulgata TaxID=6465 RepID=UPI00217FFDD3|nr:choline transporter-like protein 2 [Patella vulgata]